MLRKRLERAGLDEAIVIGGFEICYRARNHRWVLHVNFAIIGGTDRAVGKFKDSFLSSDLDRPVMTARLRDLPEQLSYLLKFVTYHRPHKQRGSTKK